MSKISARHQALLDHGFYVGDRNPDRNKDFPGKYMVAEEYDIGRPTNDASTGGFCIVGDDLDTLIGNAFMACL